MATLLFIILKCAGCLSISWWWIVPIIAGDAIHKALIEKDITSETEVKSGKV